MTFTDADVFDELSPPIADITTGAVVIARNVTVKTRMTPALFNDFMRDLDATLPTPDSLHSPEHGENRYVLSASGLDPALAPNTGKDPHKPTCHCRSMVPSAPQLEEQVSEVTLGTLEGDWYANNIVFINVAVAAEEGHVVLTFANCGAVH